MLDHVLGEILTIMDKKTEGSHVTVPAVKLVEATAGNDEWQTPVVGLTFRSVLNPLHLESEQTRGFIQVTDILFIVGVLSEPNDIQVHIRVFASNAAVVLMLFGSSTRNVNARTRVVGPIFGVLSDLSNVGTVDTAGQVGPEEVLDKTTQTTDRVLTETSLVQDNLLTTVLLGQSELL
jgi:hypothetical protein